MPTLRATWISALVSAVKVTMPSTSAGSSPASAMAAVTASQASWSSLRPDALENSVAPMPTIAAAPAMSAAHTAPPRTSGSSTTPTDVGAEAVAPAHVDRRPGRRRSRTTEPVSVIVSPG